MRARKIVVLGAGPSGLTAAHRCLELARERGEVIELKVLDRAPRAGGAIGTDEVDGFRIERGADGFITDKPALMALSERLGLTPRLVKTQPATHGAFVVREGRLLPIPRGFSMMAPTDLRAFLASPLLSPIGKARALAEVVLPRGNKHPDESLSSFVRRRFGDELFERLAQPLVGGVYGADPVELSLRATMPRFLDEERASRSVTLGLRQKARSKRVESGAQGARYGLFASFDRGMQVLVDGLTARLPAGALSLDTGALALRPSAEGRVTVETTRGEHEADHVILALGAGPASSLLAPLDDAPGRELASIRLGSAVLVNLGFARRVIPPMFDGYGIIVPEVERRASIAATFASRKWPGRAPEGKELIRVFLSPRFLEESEQAQLDAARNELGALLGIKDEPETVRIARYERVMPQYRVGHLELVATIERKLRRLSWLSLAGNALSGVGLPDTVRAAEQAALRAMICEPRALRRSPRVRCDAAYVSGFDTMRTKATRRVVTRRRWR